MTAGPDTGRLQHRWRCSPAAAAVPYAVGAAPGHADKRSAGLRKQLPEMGWPLLRPPQSRSVYSLLSLVREHRGLQCSVPINICCIRLNLCLYSRKGEMGKGGSWEEDDDDMVAGEEELGPLLSKIADNAQGRL